jgi:hypothetical protein
VAKPCRRKLSPTILPATSLNCFANGRAGLFMMRGSVIPRPKAVRKVV